MSAEVLRRAASLMRERANDATPGPWEWEPPSGDSWPNADESLVTAYVPEGQEYRSSILYGWGYDASGIEGEDGDRAHIASWHPAVALAVADWLEATLARDPRAQGTEAESALVVARTYLGEQPS